MTALCDDYSCFECPYEEEYDSYKNGRLSAVYRQAADAIERLEHQIFLADLACKSATASKPRWIPVTERLPKEMETVLVTDGKNVGWSFCVNDYGTMEFYSPWKITHWMPLPEPPKEG